MSRIPGTNIRVSKAHKFTLTKPKQTLTKKVNKMSRQITSLQYNQIGVRAGLLGDIFTTPFVDELTVSNLPPVNTLGTKQTIKSIEFKALIHLASATSDTEIARVVIVLDKRKFDNNTDPVWLDIFNSATVYSTRSATLLGKKQGSFTVLYDRVFHLTNSTSETTDNRRTLRYTKTFKKPLEQQNMDEYSQDRVYLMYMSTAATSEMDISWNYRAIGTSAT